MYFLLNRIGDVQVCDATMFNSSTWPGSKNISKFNK